MSDDTVPILLSFTTSIAAILFVFFPLCLLGIDSFLRCNALMDACLFVKMCSTVHCSSQLVVIIISFCELCIVQISSM